MDKLVPVVSNTQKTTERDGPLNIDDNVILKIPDFEDQSHKDNEYYKALKRLALIQMAQNEGSVSKACLSFNTTRTTYYRWKERFDEHGIQGLFDKEPKTRNELSLVKVNLREKVIHLSTSNPSWGCKKISQYLNQKHIKISPSSTQNILKEENLSTRQKRIEYLESLWKNDKNSLTFDQISALERYNPAFRERELTQEKWVFVQDTLFVKNINSSRLYIHFALEATSNYLYASLHRNKIAHDAIMLLHTTVIPSLKQHSCRINTCVTPSLSIYKPQIEQPYSSYLAKHNIKHKTLSPDQRNKGITVDFRNHIQYDLIDTWRTQDLNFQKMRCELESWVEYYNNSTPYSGYPLYGTPPIQAFEDMTDS